MLSPRIRPPAPGDPSSQPKDASQFVVGKVVTSSNTLSHTPLTAQISANGALQPRSALANHLRQVLEVVAGGDAKLADKVLGCRLQVAIVAGGGLLLGTPKVGVGRDGRRTLETL